MKSRSAHTEFSELLDSDIQLYIDAYDRHVAEGFHPASIEIFVAGCFMFFNSLLFLNGANTGSISADKGQGHILSMNIISLIVSTVGSAFAIAGQSMLKFDSVSQEQNITLKFDLVQIVGAIKSGAIAGSASCNNVHFSSAFIIGFVAGVVYKATCSLLDKLEIDDPMQIIPVHGACGLWGVLAVGIFDNEKGLIYAGQFNQFGI